MAAKPKVKKVPVSQRAVLQRVNRKLAHEFQQVKTWRSSGMEKGIQWQPGDLYQVDHQRNTLVDFQVDLDVLARELGVLAEWEEIAE